VKRFSFSASTPLFIDIGPATWRVLDGERGIEWPLERHENGRLTDPCRENLVSALREFMKGKPGWGLRRRAVCAIHARGVSLRRLTVPPATRENLRELLLLQIEKEFPLPPDQLAWGSWSGSPREGSEQIAPGVRELIIAAIKREALADYSDILSRCGLNPVFTLGALAGSSLCRGSGGSFAFLNIGRNQSEWITVHEGAPAQLRSLSWGEQDITGAIGEALPVDLEAAEKPGPSLDGAAGRQEDRERAVRDAVYPLAQAIRQTWNGERIFLAGPIAGPSGLADRLAQELANGAECTALELPDKPGFSAATLGLRELSTGNGHEFPLVLQLDEPSQESRLGARSSRWKWAIAAACLLVVSVGLRYAEALLKRPGLARRISAVEAERTKLPAIDRELGFLQYLRQNQPPYLEVLAILANAAPSGTRLDSVSMNGRGDLALRGSLQNADQVILLRTKLVESRFFSVVVVDEQTPTPDRDKVHFRISARWNTETETGLQNIGRAAPATSDRARKEGR
jgi:Tfp pilus assembly PilM family ATPase